MSAGVKWIPVNFFCEPCILGEGKGHAILMEDVITSEKYDEVQIAHSKIYVRLMTDSGFSSGLCKLREHTQHYCITTGILHHSLLSGWIHSIMRSPLFTDSTICLTQVKIWLVSPGDTSSVFHGPKMIFFNWEYHHFCVARSVFSLEPKYVTFHHYQTQGSISNWIRLVSINWYEVFRK